LAERSHWKSRNGLGGQQSLKKRWKRRCRLAPIDRCGFSFQIGERVRCKWTTSTTMSREVGHLDVRWRSFNTGGDYSTVQQLTTTTTIDNKYVIDRMSPFKVTQSLTTSTSLWFSRFYRRVHFSTHFCNPAISR
jgi:hypothetical protein